MSLLLPWGGVIVSFGLYKLFPASFNTLFLINIWLFSLPHTFSTFTRSDRRATGPIILSLMLLLFFSALVLGVVNSSGMVVLYSLYFYWQQFHYGKQNFGVARWDTKTTKNFDQFFYLGIVLLSLVGLTANGAQSFFGYMLYSPFNWQISKITLFMIMVLITLVFGVLRPQQLRHAISHTLIFSFAYLYCEHFALGWLFLNVFHNLQYLNFMKGYEKHFKYLLAPALLTFTLFLLQFHILNGLIIFSIPMGLMLMMALNFSHYTLDAIIWKKGP